MFSNNNYPMNNNFSTNNNSEFYDNFNDYPDMNMQMQPQPYQPTTQPGQPNYNLESVQVTEQGGYFMGPGPQFGQPGFGMGPGPQFGQPGFGMGPIPPFQPPFTPTPGFPVGRPPMFPPTPNMGFGISRCLNTVTTLTLVGNNSIWFFPTSMSNFGLSGFRWGPRGWVRDSVPFSSIIGFSCRR